MDDWEIKNLKERVDRLEEKSYQAQECVKTDIQNLKYKTYVWLMVVTVILFWLLIGYIDMKVDVNKQNNFRPLTN